MQSSQEPSALRRGRIADRGHAVIFSEISPPPVFEFFPLLQEQPVRPARAGQFIFL